SVMCQPARSCMTSAWAPGSTVRDLVEMELHGLGVAAGQNQAGALAPGGTDGAEDVRRFRALVVRRARPGAAPGPAPGELVLLADPRFVLPPYLYRGAARQARRDLCQLGREVFFKSRERALVLRMVA